MSRLGKTWRRSGLLSSVRSDTVGLFWSCFILALHRPLRRWFLPEQHTVQVFFESEYQLFFKTKSKTNQKLEHGNTSKSKPMTRCQPFPRRRIGNSETTPTVPTADDISASRNSRSSLLQTPRRGNISNRITFIAEPTANRADKL